MEKRDEIWYTLADAKTNEYYSTIVAYKYQVWDWVSTTALGLITLISVITAVSYGLNSSLMVFLGVVIVFCQVTMILNPFLLFEKYVRVFNEKKYSFMQLAHELENLWYKVEDGKIPQEEIAKEFADIHTRIIENQRFPDRTQVKTFRKALAGSEKRANEYMKRVGTVVPTRGKTPADTVAGADTKTWKTKLPGNSNPPMPPVKTMGQTVLQ